MSKGKVFTCCGDCCHYDWKNHKCKCGHSKEGTAQDSFYVDCTTVDDLEKYEKVAYNKAVDDSFNAFKEVYSLTLSEEKKLDEMAIRLKRRWN